MTLFPGDSRLCQGDSEDQPGLGKNRDRGPEARATAGPAVSWSERIFGEGGLVWRQEERMVKRLCYWERYFGKGSQGVVRARSW